MSVSRYVWILAAVPALACTDDATPLSLSVTSSLPSCALSEDVALSAACSEDTYAVTMSARSAPSAPPIDAGDSYGLRLVDEGGVNGGAIRFVPAHSGQYVLYLGTPNVPLSLTTADASLAVDDVIIECSSRLLAASCPLMRRAIGVTLEAGVEVRIELGPIAPQRWVRLRIEPRTDRPLAVATASGGASTDIYTVTAGGAVTGTIVNGIGDETLPRWSPDGTRIAYVVGGTLRVVGADGSDDHQVAATVGRGPASGRPTVNAAAWSPDGGRLLYTFPRPPYVVGDEDERIDQSYETTLHIVGVDGTGDVAYPEPFMHRFPPGMGTLYQPAWSHDGLIAYNNDDDCPDCAGGGELSTSLEDGTAYRRLVVNAGADDIHAIDFAPVGNRVVFERNGRFGRVPDLTRAEITTTSDPTVLRLVTHDLGVQGRNPVWSPDGREIAYVGADGVYVIDAFAAGAVPRRVLAATDVRGIDW